MIPPGSLPASSMLVKIVDDLEHHFGENIA